MKPIGINIPITRGSQGFFSQTFTTSDAIKSNLRNLLFTKNGERPMNPNFGNNLSTLLFESDSEVNKEAIKDKIKNVVNRYIPEVIINSIDVESSDFNSFIIYMTFSLRAYPNFIDNLSFNMNVG